MKENKLPRNDKNQEHGLWEGYHMGVLIFSGTYVNGERKGLWVDYYTDGSVWAKEYWL